MCCGLCLWWWNNAAPSACMRVSFGTLPERRQGKRVLVRQMHRRPRQEPPGDSDTLVAMRQQTRLLCGALKTRALRKRTSLADVRSLTRKTIKLTSAWRARKYILFATRVAYLKYCKEILELCPKVEVIIEKNCTKQVQNTLGARTAKFLLKSTAKNLCLWINFDLRNIAAN